MAELLDKLSSGGDDGGYAGDKATATAEAAMAGEQAAARGEEGKDLGHVPEVRGGVLIRPAAPVATRRASRLGWDGVQRTGARSASALREVDERLLRLGWAALCSLGPS